MVSVIITNFNDSQWIGKSIESVIAQEGIDWELLVVDDGSTDCSNEIIQRYAATDDRIRSVFLKQNCGISAARNIGISSATGQYIALLDSDDMLVPGSLERRKVLFEGISKSLPDVNLLVGDAWIINEKDRVRGRYMNPPFHGCLIADTNSQITIPLQFIGNLERETEWQLSLVDGEAPGWCLPSTFFFKKNGVDKFDERFRVGEAGLFIERLRSRGRVIYIGQPVVNYRIRMSSVSNSKAEQTLRGINAGSRSAQLGRLDDPITPDEMPRPNWSQLAAWKHGRNAKAAWCNDAPVRALLEYGFAFIARPKDVWLRGMRFFQGRLAFLRPSKK